MVNAPARTCFHFIRASGNTLNIIANNKVVIPKVRMILEAYIIITVSWGNSWVSRLISASIAPSTISDTSNKKLRLTTMEKESRRLKTIFKSPIPFRGLAFNFQIWLIESCISLNTLVAPTSKVITPTIVAKKLVFDKAALRIVFCI